MEKRERLERCMAGEAADRSPVSLYRHWPGDDQRSADLAHAIIGFQRSYDWDLAIVAPSDHYSVTGYGVQDEWIGRSDGLRSVTKIPIRRSLDWTELRALDPMRGDLGKQYECLRLIADEFERDQIPFAQVVYSPISQALRLSGQGLLLRNMRTHPDRLRTGLNILTESTLRWIEAIRRLPVAGICYVVELADFSFMSEAEYQTFGVPYDMKILGSLPEKWWLNIVRTSGEAPMIQLLGGYPVQMLMWADQESRPALSDARIHFGGALSGGLAATQHIHFGTPNDIRDAARAAINQMDYKRFMLSAGGPIAVSSPLSNIRAARNAV